MQWIDLLDKRLTLNGLPWFTENAPDLFRLPKRMERVVRPPVWELAQQPSGGRIRFSTDATSLAVRLHYPSLVGMNNMHKVGQMGLDLYVEDEYWSTVFPTDQQDVDAPFYSGVPSQLRNVCIYLPLYAPVAVKGIGLNEGAHLWEAGPFSVPRPVVFYGSSITQGGCASRSGMSYQAILARELLLDFVNLGFSGNGKGEKELATAVAEIDASCFVIDFAQNCDTPEQMRQVYGPFIEVIREEHPDTPIVCVSPVFAAPEAYDPTRKARLDQMRQIVRDAVAARRKAGDDHIGLVEGERLLGPDDRDGLADGVHPNDLGFQRMAEGLGLAILEALRASR